MGADAGGSLSPVIGIVRVVSSPRKEIDDRSTHSSTSTQKRVVKVRVKPASHFVFVRGGSESDRSIYAELIVEFGPGPHVVPTQPRAVGLTIPNGCVGVYYRRTESDSG